MSQAAIGRVLGLSPAAMTKLKGQGMPVDSVASAQAWREARQNLAQRKPAPPAAAAPSPRYDPMRDELGGDRLRRAVEENRRVVVNGRPVFGGDAFDSPDFGDAPGGFSSGMSEDRDEARTRREIAEANIAELQLAKLRSEVRDVIDISRGGFDIARELRDAMDSSVNTLAAELAPMDSADACARVLRRHNRTIQEMLAKSLREKLAVKVDAA